MLDDVRFVTGWLDASGGPQPDGAAVVDRLRGHGVLAGVVAPEPGATGAVELTVAVDASEEHTFVLRDGSVAVGPPLGELVDDLVRAFGGAAEIGGAFAGDLDADDAAPAPEPDDDRLSPAPTVVPQTAPRQVVLSRIKPELAVTVAHSIKAALTTSSVDGWTLIVPDGDADTSGHLWFASDLPVVVLRRAEDARYLEVRTERGMGWGGHLLSPLRRGRTTFAVGETHGDAATVLTWLDDPWQRPGSPAHAVLTHPAFADVALDRLRAALDGPDDERWFGRVLEALGLPVVAADVVEGHREPPDATVVAPGGLGSTIGRAVDGWVARVGQPGQARGWERWTATAIRRPGLAWAVVVLEAVLGAAGLWWAVTTTPRAWWVVAIGLVGALLLLDATFDGVLLARSRRRRVRT